MASTLRATWALLFWPTWPAAVDRTLLLDERSFKASYQFLFFQLPEISFSDLAFGRKS